MVHANTREFRDRPPREELTNLAAIVRDFQWRFPRERRDTVWTYCVASPSLRIAVARACASRDENGKMHNHQSRVTEQARIEFRDRIMAQQKWIEGTGHWPKDSEADPFDSLHDLLDDIKPIGVGPVTVYDVATRIGGYLGVEPTSLYLHAGVMIGIQHLSWATIDPLMVRSWRRIDRIPAAVLHTLWPEFAVLPPDEVEDLCCTYRDVFATFPE